MLLKFYVIVILQSFFLFYESYVAILIPGTLKLFIILLCSNVGNFLYMINYRYHRVEVESTYDFFFF
jgi:hypothetical protein